VFERKISDLEKEVKRVTDELWASKDEKHQQTKIHREEVAKI